MKINGGFNNKISEKLALKSARDFSFSEHTTYGSGGSARAAYFPENIPQAKLAFDLSKNGKYVVLGNGSNVLASDNYFDGAVICTGRLSGIYRAGEDVLCCLGGTRISKLLRYCKVHNFGGLEYLYGIPATVGGAAYMNAGAAGRYIGEDIIKVRLYDGKTRDLSKKACKFTYKQSTMRDINALILAVFLKIKPNCSTYEIENKINAVKIRRKQLPKGRSCGCVFKNVGGLSAGKIIQDCGLCGARIGEAEVSPIHANFIINYGSSSADVRKLIEYIKREVYRRSGYALEEEVIYIGEFDDFNG